MVIVGTSAETAATVPKDIVAVDRRTVAVRVTTVGRGPAARSVPAGRVAARDSGAIAMIGAVTSGATSAVATVAAGNVVTTTAASAVVTTAVSLLVVAATTEAVAAGRIVAVARAASGRPVAARISARSGATPARTSRTFPRSSRPANSIRRFAATC